MDVEPKIQIDRLPTNHLTSSNWEDLWGANSGAGRKGWFFVDSCHNCFPSGE